LTVSAAREADCTAINQGRGLFASGECKRM
jgi:hypothetical protein